MGKKKHMDKPYDTNSFQEISNRTHGPRTPKPGYLIALETFLGVHW